MSEEDFPHEWVKIKLSEVCLLNPKVKLDDNLNVGFMPMSDVPMNYFGKTLYEVRRWEKVKKGYTQFKDNDTLFAKITPCFENGKAAVISGFPNGWGAGSTEYYVLRPIAQLVDTKLLFALVKTKEFLTNGAANMSGSVGHRRVPKEFVENYTFPLMPLAEQKQIATQLDELLAQVDTIKTRLDAIPSLLKHFRQSVLAAAVSGKLTEEWRAGAKFSAQNSPLSNFVNIDIGHAFKSKEFTAAGVRLLRGQNIEPGLLRWVETKYFPDNKLDAFKHLYINVGDIILAMDRPIVSAGLKLARAKSEDLPCVLVQRVARFKEFSGLTPDYLMLLLSDLSFRNYLLPNQTGSDIPHISGKQILGYEVLVPLEMEQTEIVRRVEQLFTFADQIEQRIKHAQARVNHLTQSILAKAFRGELTAQWRAQNPDLISGENSAEALLERIKAERDAATPKKRRRNVKA